MWIKEAIVIKNDLRRFANGLVLLKEHAADNSERERILTAVDILRAMVLESKRWVMVPEEDYEGLKTKAYSE